MKPKPSKERLLDLILATNPGPVEASDLSLGEPVPQKDCTIPRNTQVKVTPTQGSTFVGRRTLFYDRVPLYRLTSQLDPELPFQLTNETRSKDLLEEFNRRYCTILTEADIVDEALPPYRNDCMSYVLKAHATSYGWIDCIRVRLIKRDVRLDLAVSRPMLPAFPPPFSLTPPPKVLKENLTRVYLPGLTGQLSP